MSKVETYLGSVTPLGSGDVQPSNSETSSYGENYKRQSESVETPTDQMKKYSICITHYNNVDTVRASLHSILSQIDKNFEVIVVDNFSNDGSFEVLSECARDGKITLIRERCSRGRGRQISFEKSRGDYIIANLDTDEIYIDRLKDVLSFYHSQCEGRLLLVLAGREKSARGLQNITVVPRSLVNYVGGWHDLQYCEDWDIWARAAKVGKYCYTVFNLLGSPNQHQERGKLLNRLGLRYIRYREFLRLGRKSIFEDMRWSAGQLVVYFLAWISYHFHDSYADEFNSSFDPYGKGYFVPSLRDDVDAYHGESWRN